MKCRWKVWAIFILYATSTMALPKVFHPVKNSDSSGITNLLLLLIQHKLMPCNIHVTFNSDLQDDLINEITNLLFQNILPVRINNTSKWNYLGMLTALTLFYKNKISFTHSYIAHYN